MYEFFKHDKVEFRRKVATKMPKELAELYNSLQESMDESLEKFAQFCFPEEDQEEDYPRAGALRVHKPIICFHSERMKWVIEEYRRRYSETRKEFQKMKKALEKTKTECEEAKQMLRDWEDKAGGAPSHSDTMEVEETIHHPQQQEMSPPLSKAIEAVIERKWEQLMFYTFPRSTGRSEIKTDAASSSTPKWSEVVGRRREDIPAKKQSQKGRQASQTKRKEEPVTQKRKRGTTPKSRVKGKKKVWPKLPKTAAITVTDHTLSEDGDGGGGFIRAAQRQLSLDEMGIPHLKIKRSRMGDTYWYPRGWRGRKG